MLSASGWRCNRTSQNRGFSPHHYCKKDRAKLVSFNMDYHGGPDFRLSLALSHWPPLYWPALPLPFARQSAGFALYPNLTRTWLLALSLLRKKKKRQALIISFCGYGLCGYCATFASLCLTDASVLHFLHLSLQLTSSRLRLRSRNRTSRGTHVASRPSLLHKKGRRLARLLLTEDIRTQTQGYYAHWLSARATRSFLHTRLTSYQIMPGRCISR